MKLQTAKDVFHNPSKQIGYSYILVLHFWRCGNLARIIPLNRTLSLSQEILFLSIIAASKKQKKRNWGKLFSQRTTRVYLSESWVRDWDGFCYAHFWFGRWVLIEYKTDYRETSSRRFAPGRKSRVSWYDDVNAKFAWRGDLGFVAPLRSRSDKLHAYMHSAWLDEEMLDAFLYIFWTNRAEFSASESLDSNSHLRRKASGRRDEMSGHWSVLETWRLFFFC